MVAATLWVGLCSASTSVAVPSSSEVEGVRQRCEVSEIWKLDNINHWISSGAVIPELVRAIVSTLLPSIVDTSIIVANIGERLKFAVDRAIAGCKHYYVTLNDLLRDRAGEQTHGEQLAACTDLLSNCWSVTRWIRSLHALSTFGGRERSVGRFGVPIV